MKGRRFSIEQIVAVLKRAEVVFAVSTVYRAVVRARLGSFANLCLGLQPGISCLFLYFFLRRN